MRLCQTCGRLLDDGTETCPQDGTKLVEFKPTLEPGQKVAGGFSIVGGIGVGPSGEIYEGRADDGGGKVVVRLLSADMTKDKRLSDVVRRHLLKQQEFNHKYVVRTRAVDQHEERILFVRDWVEGTRLEDLLLSEGALSVQRTLALGIRVCTALAEAHRVGLLHLQLRASNIFVVTGAEGDGESIRLVDFGVGPRCKVGVRPYYGAPGTLSPEQVEGKIVSFKSDMFAAGLLLYRMLAGKHAFEGPDDVVVKQICEATVPPIKYRPGDPIPMELWTFVRQALEKKPIHRPIGMAQMADRLKELAGDAAAGRLSLEPPIPGENGAARSVGVGESAGPSPEAERTPIGRIALRKQIVETKETPADGDEVAGIDVDVSVEDLQEVVAAATPGVPQKASEAAAEPAAEGSPSSGSQEGSPVGGEAKGDTKQAAEAEPGKPVAPPVGPKPPPKPPKTAATPAKDEAQDVPRPSSDTLPMEPEILEEVAIPPPMKTAQLPPRRGADGVEELLATTFRRGLLYGLGIGLAVAVVVFLLARFVGRSDRAAAPCTPEGRAGEAADAGPTDPRLTAAGPMQVSLVVDGNGGPGGESEEEAGSAAAEDAEAVPPAEAEPTTPADADLAGTDVQALPADAATESADSARRPADRTAPADAGVTTASEAGRPADVRPDSGRSGTSSVSAEDLARANELVSEGDAGLAARNFAGARAAYEEALRLHPQNSRAKIGLGRTAFQQGNFEDAVRYLEPIYRNQGNMDLGMAYVRVGRLGDAKRQFEKLLERNPNNSDAQRALDAVRRQLGE
ncbi:MAG: protein kinase [Deltaproteobacteria bacterium]|nr:protein kinase [Deltaproteobacteria bacterium]